MKVSQIKQGSTVTWITPPTFVNCRATGVRKTPGIDFSLKGIIISYFDTICFVPDIEYKDFGVTRIPIDDSQEFSLQK